MLATSTASALLFRKASHDDMMTWQRVISRPFTAKKSPSNASAPLLFRNKRHLWDAVPNAHASVSFDQHIWDGGIEMGAVV